MMSYDHDDDDSKLYAKQFTFEDQNTFLGVFEKKIKEKYLTSMI
jgi:hypothetical protein